MRKLFVSAAIVVQFLAATDAVSGNFICSSPHFLGSPTIYDEKGLVIRDFGSVDTSAIWLKSDLFAPEIIGNPYILTIGFLNGSNEEIDLVKEVSREWINNRGAYLDFNFVRNEEARNAHIRIHFNNDGYNFSHLGRKSLYILGPSMELSFNNLTNQRKKFLIRHEFGHALGLMHEHLNGNLQITWNLNNILRDYKGKPWGDCAPNNEGVVDIEKCTISIKQGITDKIDKSRCIPAGNTVRSEDNVQYCSTDYDINSIMNYPIPSDWNYQGITLYEKDYISDKDYEIIREMYKGRQP